jgi:hypothetical protein
MAPRIFREGLASRHRVLALTVRISIPQPNNQMEPARQTVCAIMRRGYVSSLNDCEVPRRHD